MVHYLNVFSAGWCAHWALCAANSRSLIECSLVLIVFVGNIVFAYITRPQNTRGAGFTSGNK